MALTIRLFIVIAFILILAFPLFYSGCSYSKITRYDSEEAKGIEAEEEWEQVKDAVETMCVEAVPPVTDLANDSRIDWQNSAIVPEKMTCNMTGGCTPDGELPLIAIIGSDDEILPISYYLGKDRTQWAYWIDSRGLVHLAE